jgi:hypothetical protein
MPPIGISAIGTKCRHLRREVAVALVVRHEHHPKMRAHCKRPLEHAQHHIRRGAGGHVIIRGLATQQQIAHAAAGQIGLEAGRAQLFHHRKRRLELARIRHVLPLPRGFRRYPID